MASGMLKNRKNVRMAAPKAWLKRVTGNLEDAELVRLITRLEARGFTREELVTNIVDRLKDEQRKKKLRGLLGAS